MKCEVKMKKRSNTLLELDYCRYPSSKGMPRFQKWMRKYQETNNRILKKYIISIFGI